MKRYEGNIREVLGILQGASIFDSFINASILFLLVYIVFQLINLFPLVFAILTSFIFLISQWVKKSGHYTEKFVEKEFPTLKNKLTTAKDTLKEDGYVVEKLREEVAYKLKNVDALRIFDKNNIFIKLLLIMFLCFCLLFITSMNYKLLDTENIIKNIEFKKEDTGFNHSLNITQKKNDFDIVKISSDEKSDTEYDINLQNIKAVGAKEYKDPITEEEREIVKNYFNKVQNNK